MKISSVSQMREMDRTAVETFGIEEKLLMENAGYAAFKVLSDKHKIENRRFAVICGIGNNGGDGFVIARKIHSAGGYPIVFILGDKNKFKGAAKLNLNIITKLPVKIYDVTDAKSVKKELVHLDAIVDAIFGTGLARDVGGLYKDVIEAVNQSGKPVLSADIPSGIHGDTGQIMGCAVNADYTVTFGLPKIGNLLYPGYSHCGALYVTHISFPRSLYTADHLEVAINLTAPVLNRNVTGHKKTFKETLVIAGASTYFGAPLLSALSFLKSGGGYARLAAPESMVPFIASSGAEIVFAPQKETAQKSISLDNEKNLLDLSEKADMVIIGPGLSLADETCQLVRNLVSGIKKPILIDGDGITAVSNDLDILSARKSPTILTPHPGEMARITNTPVSQINSDKINLLQKTCARLNSIIVLKGAHSLIGYPDGRVFINMSGNSGMATAGSGDVLTGSIAGMYGLGLSVPDAVNKGVFIHGLAGDLAAKSKGEDGITAQDILNFLPDAVKLDRRKSDRTFHNRYAGAIVI
ncbi:NAD(P)H-hydrate dehydratase [Desulfobacterales bacterium HSG16]|nr:NAD(P)H-hydrate dehydratase [Desulfobacterales bacterium HSG16]